MALMFGEWDVDGFLASISAEQFAEWREFESANPHGWRALNLVAQRLTWATFQRGNKAKLSEADFGFRFNAPHSLDAERARLEAFSIRSQIDAELERKK